MADHGVCSGFDISYCPLLEGREPVNIGISLIFKIATLGIVVAILHTYLKQADRSEYAFMTVLAGIAIALLWVIPVIVDLFNTVRSVFNLY